MGAFITEHFEWLEASKWLSERKEAAHRRPRLLLVDDDPIFCRMAAKLAIQKDLQLTTCTSFGELLHACRSNFDVALLDYSFGALTALQVAPMLEASLPIVLISGLERSQVRFAEWPISVETFVSKAKGMDAIFNRALEVSKWSGPRYDRKLGPAEWLPLVGAAVLLVLTYLFFLSSSLGVEPRWERIKWDAIDVSPTVAQWRMYESVT